MWKCKRGEPLAYSVRMSFILCTLMEEGILIAVISWILIVITYKGVNFQVMKNTVLGYRGNK